MRARFNDLVRLPLFGLLALAAGSLTLAMAAAPAVNVPVVYASATPSADSPEAVHAA